MVMLVFGEARLLDVVMMAAMVVVMVLAAVTNLAVVRLVDDHIEETAVQLPPMVKEVKVKVAVMVQATEVMMMITTASVVILAKV